MRTERYLQHYLIFFLYCSVVAALEPITAISAIGAAVAAGFMSVVYPIKCQFTECCTSRWINLNSSALQEELNSRLFGQHLVTSVVVKHIRAHKTKDPSKALALSFHGGTGTGKNYVSKIVAESIYKRGMKSKFVHLISATKEFPHKEMVPIYKDKLRDLIESSVKQCEQSLFIFDEVDKMPPGIIDTIKPYLDFYEQLGDTDYRKVIFLFLSNTAGSDITGFTLNHWHSELNREDITLNTMEKVIHTAALNQEKTGMYHSDLLIRHMITAFIPFLPMERKHIRECIKDRLVVKGYYKSKEDIPDAKVRRISKELQYHPEGEEIFSVTGCKRVPEKVDFVMMDDE